MRRMSSHAVDALEARICSTVNAWRDGALWHVEAACSRGIRGKGACPASAVSDWLVKAGLETRH